MQVIDWWLSNYNYKHTSWYCYANYSMTYDSKGQGWGAGTTVRNYYQYNYKRWVEMLQLTEVYDDWAIDGTKLYHRRATYTGPVLNANKIDFLTQTIIKQETERDGKRTTSYQTVKRDDIWGYRDRGDVYCGGYADPPEKVPYGGYRTVDNSSSDGRRYDVSEYTWDYYAQTVYQETARNYGEVYNKMSIIGTINNVIGYDVKAKTVTIDGQGTFSINGSNGSLERLFRYYNLTTKRIVYDGKSITNMFIQGQKA